MTRLLIILSLCLFLFGCQTEEKYTKEQWLERYKPADVNQANAMAILQTDLIKAKSDAASQSMMDKFKMACIAGAVASVIAVVCGFRLLGAAGLAGCIAGFGLAYASSEYAKYVAIGGLVFGLAIGGFAVYIIIRALREIVVGQEKAKEVDKNIKPALEAGNVVQSVLTRKIVKKIKGEKSV